MVAVPALTFSALLVAFWLTVPPVMVSVLPAPLMLIEEAALLLATVEPSMLSVLLLPSMRMADPVVPVSVELLIVAVLAVVAPPVICTALTPDSVVLLSVALALYLVQALLRPGCCSVYRPKSSPYYPVRLF